jgi:hypothetical protein
MLLAGLLLGTILLGVGLFRARVVPRWTAVLILLSVVVSFFAGDGLLIPLISSTLGFIGLGAIGVMVLQQSDTDWAKHGSLG